MTWIVAAPVGLALGLLYFEGLWWTVRRLAQRRRPGLLLGSRLFRLALLALALAALAQGDGARMLVALPAFLAARWYLLRRHGGLGRQREMALIYWMKPGRACAALRRYPSGRSVPAAGDRYPNRRGGCAGDE